MLKQDLMFRIMNQIDHYQKDSKSFIEYLNDIDDIHINIEKFNLNKKCKILIIFDNMVAEMVSNKKTQSNSN